MFTLVTEGLPSVAIVGRPNVGKSALFNRLVRRKIAIVHDQPGITRDRISATCTRGQRPFLLWDTAGIFGAGESQLRSEVTRAAEQALRESDLLLLVVDAKDGLSPMDQDLARSVRRLRKPVVLVVNKIDNDKHEALAADFDSLGFDKIISISAEHNRGIAELLDEIDQLLPEGSDEHSAISNSAATAVAIVGRPNVGKSSLINSIVQDERAIVSEIAGTTRDAIDVSYERDGERFVFIDTAGIRRRGRHSTSAEVFSVMRAERSIRRADICILTVDLSLGVTAQDRRIAGLIQQATKPCLVILNKWDLIKPARNSKQAMAAVLEQARRDLFFLDYSPMLVVSALRGENVDRVFRTIHRIQAAAQRRIGTGVLNRMLRGAFAANPPPMRKGKRLKLFYAAQTTAEKDEILAPPQFLLFVNDPSLMSAEYKRYLIARIRDAEPYQGLPILLSLRARSEK